MLHGVDLEAAAVEAQDLDQGRLHAAGTAQHGFDPGDELARAERLDQVVVGAQPEAVDALVLAGLGRQHEDGHVGAAADVAADLLAGHVGQHEVEHDEGRAHALGERQAVGAVAGDEHRVAVALEVGAHDLLHGGLVVDDDDLLVLVHR